MSAPYRRVSPPDRGPARVVSRPRRTRSVLRAAVPAGPHPVELAGLLHELTASLLAAESFPQALNRLTAHAVAAVPGAVRSSVVLIGEGGPLTHAGHGAAGAAVDAVQYAAGTTGPGLEAARTRSTVTVPDLATDARWPDLAAAARAEGVHAVAAVPLDLPRADVGALSLYFDTTEAPGADHLLTAMALANQAELLLGELRRRDALSSGAVIDRAIGVIIAQRGCGVQEAYTVLRDTAQRLGLDRQAVAGRLITVAARNA
ncbi:GAF and ANTAR domain-containing protein [Paractinoplanes abujensis]|uniref:GAF domain-containing protein n=1 Tax=Paractinoplanes abujensis TaxID=882441 RepID=A0A7W7CUW7_9ACTN|nr:GAF and ANTAR domain-containing protein [Actinoplanes abujensis]MBB4694864.1 GAF domain-containing protein [Actinoplanes abujensis]